MSSQPNRSDAGDRTAGTGRPNVSTDRTGAHEQGETYDTGVERDAASAAATGTTADRAVRVAALRAEADLLRAERGDLRAQVDTLEAEVASLESEVASLESELAAAHAETERVRQRYEGIIEEKDRAYRRAANDEPDGPLASVRGCVGAVVDRLRRD